MGMSNLFPQIRVHLSEHLNLFFYCLPKLL